jgi:uncharacterized ferredoxin-like protein
MCAGERACIDANVMVRCGVHKDATWDSGCDVRGYPWIEELVDKEREIERFLGRRVE